MAVGKKRKAKGSTPKAKASVTARRAKRTQRNAVRRASKGVARQRRVADARQAAEQATGQRAERVAAPPDTVSGLEPSEEKQVLDALDADEREFEDDVENV